MPWIKSLYLDYHFKIFREIDLSVVFILKDWWHWVDDNINLLSSDYTSNFKIEVLGWWHFLCVKNDIQGRGYYI